MACTANRRWHPAPVNGGGMEDACKEVYATQFEALPHTGMVYTPPKYSDHIGVSCVLFSDIKIDSSLFFTRRGSLDKESILCTASGGTKRQVSITSFFTSTKTKRNREREEEVLVIE